MSSIAMIATRTRVLSCLSLLAATAALATPVARACCMVPLTYAGDVDQSAQHAIVCHHDGHEELVLRVRPFFHEADEPPASLAWLVTVPSAPTGYSIASADVFETARGLYKKLHGLYNDQRPKPLLPSLGADRITANLEAAGLSIGEIVTVGPYTITPVTTLGASAVEELNFYLAENGFGEEDPDHLRWFAQNEFTFLCIKITPPAGSERLGQHLDLPPLQVGFASELPYYPGMYSAQQGDFALELTTLTSRPIARQSMRAVCERLRARSSTTNLFTVMALPDSLGSEVQAALPGGGAEPERWYVNRFDSSGVNPILSDGNTAISQWTEDISWKLGGAADQPPGWYYGDGSRPLFHVNNRPLFLLVAVLIVLIGLRVMLSRRGTRGTSARPA